MIGVSKMPNLVPDRGLLKYNTSLFKVMVFFFKSFFLKNFFFFNKNLKKKIGQQTVVTCFLASRKKKRKNNPFILQKTHSTLRLNKAAFGWFFYLNKTSFISLRKLPQHVRKFHKLGPKQDFIKSYIVFL
jgi:hypothetical protein